jgi:ABC-type Fe3+/spermidine/putrescine transport system ATPase subunit
MDFLAVEGLTKFFGGLAAVYQVGFTIQEGEIIGLIGPNGSGKTTVLNLITGFLKPNAGRVTLAGKDVTGLPPHRMCQNGVARTFQLTKSFPCCTVLQNVMIAENAPKYGYQVVVYETYTPRTEDMSAMILKAKEAGAETLLTVPAPPDGITMVKQMVELGWTPKFALMIRAPENVTWAETLGKNGDYFTIFPGWHHAENFPGVAELNAKYQAQFGRPADLLTGPAYACVQIAAAAIEKAGTLDREAIRDAIAATNMTTVVGPVTFNTDGTGNVLNPLIQWQNGKQELVWPPEHASAKLVYPAPPFDKR